MLYCFMYYMSYIMLESEKGEVLLRGVGALRYVWILGESSACQVPISVRRQPDGLTVHTKKWFLGAGFLGALPISLRDIVCDTVSSHNLDSQNFKLRVSNPISKYTE